MRIRETNKIKDADKIWAIIHNIISEGNTWVFSPDSSKEKMLGYWFADDKFSYVCEIDDEIAGIFFFKANQPDLGSHVANAGYMVSEKFRGRGIAEKLCRFSMEEARKKSFKAMQFNIVISTNEIAVRVWKKCGFEIVGTLPKAFYDAKNGYTDAYVMYQWIAD